MKTKKQINVTKSEFLAYEEVRLTGHYNMLTPEARQQVGVDRNTYIKILENYSSLAKKYLKKETEHDYQPW